MQLGDNIILMSLITQCPLLYKLVFLNFSGEDETRATKHKNDFDPQRHLT